jgi:hypothetical protein
MMLTAEDIDRIENCRYTKDQRNIERSIIKLSVGSRAIDIRTADGHAPMYNHSGRYVKVKYKVTRAETSKGTRIRKLRLLASFAASRSLSSTKLVGATGDAVRVSAESGAASASAEGATPVRVARCDIPSSSCSGVQNVRRRSVLRPRGLDRGLDWASAF